MSVGGHDTGILRSGRGQRVIPALGSRVPTFLGVLPAEGLAVLSVSERHNLLSYSDDFSQAAWLKSQATVANNSEVAPDGYGTGLAIAEDAVAGVVHSLSQNYTHLPNTAYCYSMYVKAGTRNFAAIRVSHGSVATATFDLRTGELFTSSGTTGTPYAVAAGGGWWRLVLPYTTGGSVSTNSLILRLADDAGNMTYTGLGAGYFVHGWGAQLVEGLEPRQYQRSSDGQNVASYVPNGNLLSYSEELGNAVWTNTNTTTPGNTAANPLTGGMSADTLKEDATAAAVHSIFQAVTVDAGQPLTISAYAKRLAAGSARNIRLGAGASHQQVFTLSGAGSLGTTTGSGVGYIEALPDGWYYCRMTVPQGLVDGVTNITVNLHNGSTTTYTGDATSGVHLFGVYAGSGQDVSYGAVADVPTSIVPTSALPGYNMIRRSWDFTSASWVKTRSVATAQPAQVNPFGVAREVAKWDEDTTTANDHRLAQASLSAAPGCQYTYSMFVKGSQRFRGELRIYDETAAAYLATAFFNLNLATITLTQGAGAVHMEQWPNDWYRVAVTATVPATSSSISARAFLAHSGGATVYDGVADAGMFVYGAQLVPGATMQEYEPTYDTTSPRVLGGSRAVQGLLGGTSAAEASDPLVRGNYLTMDSADYITYGRGTTADVGAGSFSFYTVIRPANVTQTNVGITGKRGGDATPTNPGWGLRQVLTAPVLELDDGILTGSAVWPFVPAPVLVAGAWVCVGVTVDRATGIATCYINGAVVGTVALPVGLGNLDTVNPLTVGKFAGGGTGGWTGDVAVPCVLYKRAHGAEEQRTVYHALQSYLAAAGITI